MERTHPCASRSKTTQVPSRQTAQPQATVQSTAPRRERKSMADPSPPTPTVVTLRHARAGGTPAARDIRAEAKTIATGGPLPPAQLEVEPAHEPLLDRPSLTPDQARALLKKELPLHLIGEAVQEACKTVYDLCVREKLDAESIRMLMRTMLEAHAPNALRGANATVNLLGFIVPIKPDHKEWFTSGYQEILVHMMVGVAQAVARPGEPALSDAFLGQVALALTAIPKSEREGKCSHPDGLHFRLGLVRQFSIDVLGQLPANSAGAFLHPLRKLPWLMENVAYGEPRMLNHLVRALAPGFGLLAPNVHHEHLDRLTDFVLSLGLSLPDAGVQLSPCMATWEPWLPEETTQEAYRRGILERMSGRPTLSPDRAGEAVLASLVRYTMANRPDGEDLVWQYPAFGSLARFDTLAGIHRASLLVPGLPSPQQARLLRLALMASGQKPGADEFREQLHQLVVDQALRGDDLDALTLMACAFVRGGGAKDTKSLERAVDIVPGSGGKVAPLKKAEKKAAEDVDMAPTQEAVKEARPQTRPSAPATDWIQDLRAALEPRAASTRDRKMEASSSTTTSGSSRPLADAPPLRDGRELVQALRRGGVLAGAPLKALAMEDLGWPRRLALFDGALAVCAPLSEADARAMARQLESAPCTDAVKAQALQIILRHAVRSFAAEGQKPLWALLAKGLQAEIAMEDDAPAIETKASRPVAGGQQLLFAKDAPLDMLKVAYDVVCEDGNRAWDAVVKARALPLAHDRRPLLELLDATLARLTAAQEGAAKSKDPRAQQLVDEAQGRIKILSQARREFTPPSAKG